MNNCAISHKVPILGRKFNGINYKEIASLFLENKDEGYFYDVISASNVLENYAGKREKLFSPQKFISEVYHQRKLNKTVTRNDYFSKDLNTVFENAVEPLSYFRNSLEQKLIKLAFIDPEKRTVTIDNSGLNSNIQEFKNDLFKQVFEYVKANKPEEYKDKVFTPLYINKRYNENSSYREVISDLGEIFKSKNYSPDVSIYNPKELQTLNIFNAGVTLANFDSLVENYFKSILSVNSNNFGVLDNPLNNNFHYFLEFKGSHTEYWKDSSHESDSAEKYSSNFLKVLASTIPLLDVNGKERPNQYLGINGLYLIGTLIKSIDSQNFDINSFQKSPKENLKSFLNKLITDGKLEYKDKLQSLYKYLYGARNGVVNLIKLAKSANPDVASSIIDVESVVAHQMNNVIATTYGIYSTTTGEKRLVNLVERDFKIDELKSYIVDSIIQNRDLFNSIKINKGNVNLKTSQGEININTIKSPDAYTIKFLKDLTGLDINSNFMKVLMQTKAGQDNPEGVFGKSISSLLTLGDKVIKIYQEKGAKGKEEASNLLGSDTNVLDLLTASVANLSPDANMTFKDSNGNSIPTIKQSNLAHEKKSVISLAKEHFGPVSNNLLYLKYPNLFKGTETLLEVEGEKATQALYLNPEENFFLSYVENYLKPLGLSESEVKGSGRYLSFKLVNYSDKSTILHEMIDQYHDIDGLGTLKTMSLDNLKSVNRKYTNNFYSNIIDNIVDNYSKLVIRDPNGDIQQLLPGLAKEKTVRKKIDRINDFLVTNGKNLDKIKLESWSIIDDLQKNKSSYNNISEGQLAVDESLFLEKMLANSPNIELTDEVSYSKYKDGLRFNRTIEQYYFGSIVTPNPRFEDNIKLAEKLFVKQLLEVRPNIRPQQMLGKKFSDTISKKAAEGIYTSLGLKPEN